MPADPEIINISKILTSTVARILIPVMIIAGIIGVGYIYLESKLLKKIDNRKKRKKQSNPGDRGHMEE